jgi:hypothetical protein|tara:strand:+ start:1508 stop:3145 length:1638 start_codon:yes stop_codon:yes gene_type:complete
MAKKTAGLNLAGSADPSIVQAATRVGMAAKPVDLSKQFGMIAQGYSQQMASIGQVGAQIGQVAGTLAIPLINKAVDRIKTLNTQNIGMPNVDANLIQRINEIKEDGKNKRLNKETKDLGKTQLDNIVNSANQLRAGSLGIDFSAFNLSPAMYKDFDPKNSSKKNMTMLFARAAQNENYGPLTKEDGVTDEFVGVQLMPFANEKGEIKFRLEKGNKVISGIDNEGKLQYTSEDNDLAPFTVDVKDFSKNLIVESQLRSVYNGEINNAIKEGVKTGFFDETALVNRLKNAKTKEGQGLTSNDQEDLATHLFDIADETYWEHLQGLNETTANAFLESNPKVAKTLLNYARDIDGKDGVTAADFEGEEGFKNYIYALSKSPEGLIAFLKNEAKENYNKFPKKDSDRDEESDKYYINQQYVPKNKVDKDVKLLNQDPNTIPRQIAWNGTVWRKQNGQYQVYEPDLKKYVNTTKDNLSVILRFDETVGYKASTSSTSSTSEMTIQEANNILAGKKQAVSFEEIEEARAVLGVTLLGNPVYKGFKNKKLLDE